MEPGCAPSVSGEKVGMDAFQGGSTGTTEIPLWILARVSDDCAVGINPLESASPLVRGLQTCVATHGAWKADGARGPVHVLVNYGRESSALLAGLPLGTRGRRVVSTGWLARPRCPLSRSTRVSK